MHEFTEYEGVWFVYDGECPICSRAADAFKIKKSLGKLHAIDARKEPNHPILIEIENRGYDLDLGMIIYHGGAFYHGKDALHFMANYGDYHGFFNLTNKILFMFRPIAALLYPSLRGIRNQVIRMQGKSLIDNLERRRHPMMKPVFAKQWGKLAPVLQERYNIRPYSDDSVLLHGELDIYTHKLLRLFRRVFRFAHAMPIPHAKKVKVKVNVEVCANLDTPAMHMDRSFLLPDEEHYQFDSYLLPRENGEAVEVTKLGFCWRATFNYENARVMIHHRGYAWKFFNIFIPLPLGLLLGQINAHEWAIDHRTMGMKIEINHWLFGRLYSYGGELRLSK